MKVAVSAYGKDLDAQLDSRFGRCTYFLVVDPDDMRYEVFKNESAVLGGGAGIQSAQFMASKGVDAVITGNCGPNAVQTLAAAGVVLFVGQKGTVKEVVERFKKGELRPTGEATVDSHFGMASEGRYGPDGGTGGGRGTGPGMGGGRGMGHRMGGGRGMGGRVDFSEQSTPKKKESGSVSKDPELETLKKKADDINRQLKNIVDRINQLETTD
jgi:predicted Fe-Mo cluster-binding NifX family protein